MPLTLLDRKTTAFVLWRLDNVNPPPMLVIGTLQPGAPIQLTNERSLTLQPVAGFSDLWEIAAANCQLTDGEIYHYWFAVAAAGQPSMQRITDPTAFMVDWRLTDADSGAPAAVIRFKNGRLVAADAGDGVGDFSGEPALSTLPPNNRLVIYELPTTWTVSSDVGGRDSGVGSFCDVTALIDAAADFANFDGLDLKHLGNNYLVDLGINALELLPPADSEYNRQWGYGTTNFLAPDYELGFPRTYSFPAPNRDLVILVRTCHIHQMRFFVDVVMAFSKDNPCLHTAPNDFFILDPSANPTDPDAQNSRGSGLRNGYGASLFRYANMVPAFDPLSGQTGQISPARQLMIAALRRWMADFHVDGIRMDSVENVANWDFIEAYKDEARRINQARFTAQGAAAGADPRFLVVGEELSEPLALLHDQTPDGRQHARLDGLWHENFKSYIRYALQGRNHPNESTFEWTVRKAIDCRLFGYADLAQAVIYLTSHDVEGFRNERFANFCWNNGIVDVEKRAKLAFACLLTAVGVPMILAGEEFADQHDLFDANGNVTQGGGKQVDPVNFARLADDWRHRIRQCVARLITLRTSSDALAGNDVSFIHVDFNDTKRVLVWQRGTPGSTQQVVVVANFSDYGSPGGLSGEYIVPTWPAAPAPMSWYEITQDRPAPQAGREPIFAWEAKVYALK